MGLQITWQSDSCTAPGLVASHVHVHAWHLLGEDTDTSAHLHLLSRDEIARADRFRFSRHRGDYVLAHAHLRRILSSYVGVPAEQLLFVADQFGKPRVAHPRTDVMFNLSHSSGICVLAVSRGEEIGVDVERLRPIEEDVARSHFSPRELADLGGLTGDAWTEGFYRCWTSKEALLKAEGFGLNIALDAFDVAVLPGSSPALLGSRPHAGFTRRWQLYELELGENVAAMLAGPPGVAVSCFRYE